MQSIESLLATVAVKRSVGSKANDKLLSTCETIASSFGYEVQSQKFLTHTWSSSLSFITLSEESCTVLPSIFSPPCKVTAPLAFVSQRSALLGLDASSSILVVHGSLAAEPIRETELLDLLIQTEAKAIICLTGTHESTGLSPFPLIASASFLIPSCYAPSSLIESLMQAKEDQLAVTLQLFSNVEEIESRQLLCSRPSSKQTLLVTAPLDSTYGTPGTLFHAGSLAVLLSVMQQTENRSIAFLIANGQAYDRGTGSKVFLQHNTQPIQEVISLTALGCKNSETAYTSYGSIFDTELKKRGLPAIQNGVARFDCGLPELVLSSSDQCLAKQVRDTQLDTMDIIDLQILMQQTQLLGEILSIWRS